MSFKSLDLANDVASVVSAINEIVSVSSSIYSGNLNIKFYNNIASGSTPLGGYWQTVFDAAPTASTSTAIMDITYGYSSNSPYNIAATAASSQNEKTKIYRQMASLLLGNQDSAFSLNNQNVEECFFIMFKRGIQKDELKKGTTQVVVLNNSGSFTGTDVNAGMQFKQLVGGDVAPIYNGVTEIGQVWYNAGIIMLGASASWHSATLWSGSMNLSQVQYSGTIDNAVDGLRGHVGKVALHNQTNLYSTIYFCRASNSEFNYSSNPTFVDDNKRIRVTSGSNVLQTRTYVTTVGLYDVNDNLLAVGKVNKPITKSPDQENIFRVRLDY